MSDVISLVEHESIPIVSSREPGQKALANRHIELLANLEKVLPAGAFQRGHQSIKWKQFCGVVQLQDVTLEILPKIYGRESDPGSSRQALIRMLQKARLLPNHKIGQANINVQKHTLLDVFIFHFCDELQQQLIQGKVREYVSHESNLPVIRGRLLLGEQVKVNLVNKERLYCRFDELCEDVLLNKILRFTLKLILPLCRTNLARQRVSDLFMAFDKISDEAINVDSFQQLNLNRNNMRYSSLIEQCRLFVQGLNPDVLAGGAKAYSLLFDMNRLFEAWVASTIRKPANALGLRLKEQGPRKYLAYRTDADRSVFQMKPDLALLNGDDEVVLIGDAKWKLLSKDEIKLGISQPDLYQLIAYANRYDVKNLILYFPAQQGLRKLHQLEVHGVHQCNVKIVCVDVLSNDVAIPEF